MLLEPPKVLRRVIQSVGMIDPQPIQLALGQKPEHQTVGRLENVLAFHAEGGEVVDVKEPPVVDLIGSDPPVGQPVALVLQEVVQEVEASGFSRLAVEDRDVLFDERTGLLVLGCESRQPAT